MGAGAMDLGVITGIDAVAMPDSAGSILDGEGTDHP
jgi:hypothetical protein